MNIYYLFSVKDKYFTDLSFILKNKNVFNQFYGMAYAKTRVLNNEIYSHISYISDILANDDEADYEYLTQIEDKYSVIISEMIHSDRHLVRFKKNKRLFIAQELIKTFIKDVTSYNIFCVMAEAVDDFISYFASYYCKYHNIEFLFTNYCGYGNKSSFCDNVDAEPNNFKNTFYKVLPLVKHGDLDVSFLETEINKYIDKKTRPEYHILSDTNYIPFRFKDIKIFFNYLSAYILDKNGMHYEKYPLLLPYHRALKIIRKSIYRTYLRNHSVSLTQLKNLNYFVYPLHFEPECSVLMQGRWFNDQIKIIELISKNLPANIILLVKEHQPMIGRRVGGFYQQITKYHNVFLIDDKVEPFEVVCHSKGAIIISSTLGMEALMLKKPVMAFGERFFNVSKNVYVIDNFRNIKETIVKMLNHKFDLLDSLAVFYALHKVTKNMGNISHVDYTQGDLTFLGKEIQTIMNK